MYKRRNAIFFNRKSRTVPIINTCQVCNKVDAINCCNICEKIICLKDTKYYNKNTFCLDCFYNNEINTFVIIKIIEDNKYKFLKKIKSNLIDFFSFQWIYFKNI